MNRALIATVAVALQLSCAHDANLTADEHRAEADRHAREADRERAEAAGGHTRTPAIRGQTGADYDPAEAHLSAADSEMRRAAAHLAAAKELERFEDQACAAIAPAERAACPLLASSVARVRETRVGVELVLKPSVDAADTNRRLNCHLAYARANGFAKPSCPLFVAGMAIRLLDGGVIEMSGPGDVGVELQKQARRIFGAAPPTVSVAP